MLLFALYGRPLAPRNQPGATALCRHCLAMGFGFRVQGLGFRVLGFGLRKIQAWEPNLRVLGFTVLGFRVFGFRVLGFTVLGLKVRVQGLGRTA